MDIQVASNFERALFEASGRDSAWVRSAMEEFATTRTLTLPPEALADLRRRYRAEAVSDAQTLATIGQMAAKGRIVDPHTAVALTAASHLGNEPVVVLATAHPAKFPEAIRKATGQAPPLPPGLAGLYEGVERVTVLPNDRAAIRDFIGSSLVSR
jgi:threonine synthase